MFTTVLHFQNYAHFAHCHAASRHLCKDEG